MKLIISFVLIGMLAFSYSAQEEQFPCSTDEINSSIFHNHPDKQQAIKNNRSELKTFTQEYSSQNFSERSDEPYIIPVVFHIIHDYGMGNISEEQIFDGLEMVNTQFRKRNADTSNIIEEFKHLAADTEIEFRLARKDPDGNCTNGITRTYSLLTNTGGHVVKDLIMWPPNQYLNIWVCTNVGPNLAGHCLMPDVAEEFPEWDGIVIQHSYVGSIGTSSHNKRTVLTHELGHYLNLFHIWGGNNVPEFYYLPVADSGNCDHDDEVEDTPNTIGWQSCNLNGTTCGSLDMVQNYMDYSYCSLLFTEGQKQRMHATLNSPIAGRNNLWTEQNLIATGLKDNPETLCEAKFISSERVICEGESVTFSDVSYFGVTERNWEFEGGDITNSSDSSVVITYNTPGKFKVSFSTTDGTETQEVIEEDYIIVIANTTDNISITEGFEDENNYQENWYLNYDQNPVHFERINYGKDSDYSVYVDNFNGPEKASYSLRSIPINTTEMTKLAITFDYAFAKMSTSNNEKLQVRISKDCGNTWVSRKSITLTNNFSVETDEPYFPSNEDWIDVEVEATLGSYKVENLLIEFLFEGNQGNNIFIDNIQIFNYDFLDLSSEIIQNKLSIYPNPTKHIFNITLGDEFLNGEIQITDITGKVVYQTTVKNLEIHTINVESFSKGTYFLNYIPTDNKMMFKTKKLIIN